MAPSAENGANVRTNAQCDAYYDDRNTPAQKTVYTTASGGPVPHPYESQRAGENGPLLLQDYHLIDLLSHFDRERIPEVRLHLICNFRLVSC